MTTLGEHCDDEVRMVERFLEYVRFDSLNDVEDFIDKVIEKNLLSLICVVLSHADRDLYLINPSMRRAWRLIDDGSKWKTKYNFERVYDIFKE